MALLLLVGPKVLPEYRNAQAARLDPASVALSLAALLPTIFGIKQLARHGWQPVSVVAVLVGVAAGVAFVRRQRRLADPLLDLRLFGNRTIGTSLAGQLTYSMMGGGFLLFMTLYLQVVQGMSTLQTGLAMMPGMASGALGFMMGPKLASRFRPGSVIAAGLLGAAAVLAAFTQVTGGSAGTATLIVGFAVMAFCGAPMAGLGTNLVVGSAPPEKMGAAGSMAQMANEFGGTLGFALLGTVGTAVYRHQIGSAVPAGIPAHLAAAARDSIAGAASAAANLPDQIGAALLTPAQHAFANGLNTVAGIGAAMLAGIAVLVATRLNHMPPIGHAVPGQKQIAATGEVDNADAAAASVPA
jgi:MFS transporter, DHA2 family, multidrug resistance protein